MCHSVGEAPAVTWWQRRFVRHAARTLWTETCSVSGDRPCYSGIMTDESSDGHVPVVVPVTLSDFPVYDGSVAPASFVRQCRRLAGLGGIPAEKLGSQQCDGS